MPDYKAMLKEKKEKWHSSENQGSGIRGQVKTFIGRGEEDVHSKHVAQPLSSLRDPASFGPPPKRIANTGRSDSSSPSPSPARPGQYGALPAPAESEPGITSAEEEAPPPPKPYRMDNTGLSTSHLPPPPGRRDGADGRSPPPSHPPTPPTGTYGSARPGPPSLPPRLPPRSGSGSPAAISPTPMSPPALPVRSPPPGSPARAGLVNQGAINRLGAAGVSVPGLGIGKPRAAPPSAGATPSAGAGAQMNELQSRFSRLGTAAAKPDAPPPPPSQGTTFAEKQAALRTAAAFRQDPGAVSTTDARAAFSTMNNFRQRHGDQVAAGLQSAGAANEKYGLAGKVGGLTAEAGDGRSNPAAGLIAKKKPAPPPPKKKPELMARAGGVQGDSAPPPVPMSTRPQF